MLQVQKVVVMAVYWCRERSSHTGGGAVVSTGLNVAKLSVCSSLTLFCVFIETVHKDDAVQSVMHLISLVRVSAAAEIAF